jgi:hypothetical protein
MSEEGGFGLGFAEKFFGLLILIIGSLAMYFVSTSLSAMGGFAGFFVFLNLILIALGFVLLTAKTE